jgi:hypothetical protein
MNASNASSQDVITKQNLVSAATIALAALPTPSNLTTLSYTMTCVGLNETKVGTDASGRSVIYINSNALALAKTGTSVGSVIYPPVDASGNVIVGSQIQGVGVSANPTKIVSWAVVPSVPSGLYPSCVALTVDNTVNPGDGVFYLVGGEVSLYNFIM